MSLILLVAAALLVMALAAVQNLVADEVAGWLPYLSRLLVGGAVGRLPEAHRARYREEWAAELMQLDDRRLTGLVYAVGLWVGASAMRGKLAQYDQSSSVTLLHLSDPHFGGRTRQRDTPLVDWTDVVAAMHDPGLSHVEMSITDAGTRFAAVLAPSEPSPAMLMLERLRQENAVARRLPAAALGVFARPEDPGFWTPRPRAPRSRARRRGPAGRVDPEWSIAPMTAAERRRAEPYFRELADPAEVTPALCAGWPSEAQETLRRAVATYDDRAARAHSRRRGLDSGAVRLGVFLDSWLVDRGSDTGRSTTPVGGFGGSDAPILSPLHTHRAKR